jgi:hypothetical protein
MACFASDSLKRERNEIVPLAVRSRIETLSDTTRSRPFRPLSKVITSGRVLKIAPDERSGLREGDRDQRLEVTRFVHILPPGHSASWEQRSRAVEFAPVPVAAA